MKFPNTKSTDLIHFLSGYINEMQKGFESIDLANFKKIINVLETAIKRKSTIYTCGNGGSSSIAEHFACDFLKGSSTDTSIQPLIYSLSSNTPTITAVANDISYNDIFSFQLEKYGKEGDVLVCVSSSGNSPNIIKALTMARSKSIESVAVVGFDGGQAKNISDYCIHIPNKNYGIVEDVHHCLMHMLSQYIRLKNMKDKDSIEQTIF